MDPSTRRRLRAVEALITRGATEGERTAARHARQRILDSLGIETAEFQAAEPVARPRGGPAPDWAKAAAEREMARRAARAAAEAALKAAEAREMARREQVAAERARREQAARAAADEAIRFEAAERARHAEKTKAAAGKLAKQPQMQRLLDLARRPTGATAEEICAALGIQRHTARAAISRLKRDGVQLKTVPRGRAGSAVYTLRDF